MLLASARIRHKIRLAFASVGPTAEFNTSKTTDSCKLGSELRFIGRPTFQGRRLQIFEQLRHKSQALYDKAEKPEITIKLPDGRQIQGKAFLTTPYSIAKSISRTLADNSIVARVKYLKKLPSSFSHTLSRAQLDEPTFESAQEELLDMNRPLEGDCLLQLVGFEDRIGKQVLWHSSSHLLGQALESKFGAWLCHGPSIEQGFFYDSFMGSHKISQNDYEGLENEVKKYVHQKESFERIILTKSEALDLFSYNPFKTHLIESKVPDNGFTSAYRCGNLIDLCTGPHIPSASMVKGFKVLKNSSAYWLGKKENDDLQRVYGIAFPKQAMLESYLKEQEELGKRDHRTIGQKQDLFHFTTHSPGSALFYPHGTVILNRLQDLMRSEYKIRGYHEVQSPSIYSAELWKMSGHYFKYKENIFWIKNEGEEYGLKPMNCPGHCVMFGLIQRSYKDLPYRMADFGILHRNQLHGALSGLTRVRKFQQDDAHIFCRPDQIESEIMEVLDLLNYIYSVFNFKYSLELSTRPEHYLGKLQDWNQSEKQLTAALDKFGRPYKINKGDGAFYGPKIDVKLLDAFGREHQCGTIQLDFQLPQRFNLQYRAGHVEENKREDQAVWNEANDIGPEGTDISEEQKYSRVIPVKKGFERPVIIHRAIFGSLERFLAILCEQTAGKWDFWISPRQLQIIPLSKNELDFAKSVENSLILKGYSVHLDQSGDKLDKKIRNAQLESYNYIGVIGHRQMEEKAITLRKRGEKEPFGTFKIKQLLQMFEAEGKPPKSQRRIEMEQGCDFL